MVDRYYPALIIRMAVVDNFITMKMQFSRVNFVDHDNKFWTKSWPQILSFRSNRVYSVVCAQRTIHINVAPFLWNYLWVFEWAISQRSNRSRMYWWWMLDGSSSSANTSTLLLFCFLQDDKYLKAKFSWNKICRQFFFSGLTSALKKYLSSYFVYTPLGIGTTVDSLVTDTCKTDTQSWFLSLLSLSDSV